MRALLLTGPLGSGKTATAVEISYRLMAAGVPTAAIDLDWLAWVGPDLAGAELMTLLADNLALVVGRMARAGVTDLVLARGLLEPAHRAEVERALPGWALTVVRLDVDPDVARSRFGARDDGAELAELLANADRIARAVATAGVEDVVVAPSADASVSEVADQVLAATGWLVGGP